MNKLVLGVAVAFLAVVGLEAGIIAHQKPQVVVMPATAQQEQALGASASPDHYSYEQFFAGMGSAKFSGLNSVSASTTSSTIVTLYVALGAGTSGQFTLGTGTPASNVVYASTTAVTANSMIFVQPTASTTIAGITCNTTPPTSTVATVVFASSTNLSLNGFKVTAGSIPATNPLCYNYWILDKSR